MEYLKRSNVPEYSVSEISNAIKGTVEDNFSYLKIRGEVSGLKLHSSGHIYFTLKDENAVLNAVCFRNTAVNLQTLPEEGLEIIVTGKITTYKQRSNYQILVSNIETAGVGALMALFEKRKKALTAAGYFDAEHKLSIQRFPRRIAIITSETGAVFHDICHRVKERFPCHIMLFPVLVQGKGAEMQIANAIHQINEITAEDRIPDIIIIARGGGSIEDLWCFNEEIIVKSVFDSKIPIISAIGHETDTTLIDYVSDLRAPTPTAAAELATPVRTELEMRIKEYGERNFYKLSEYMKSKEEMINYLSLKKPDNILDNFYQRLDDLDDLLAERTKNYNVSLENKINHLGLKLIHPKTYLENLSLIFSQKTATLEQFCKRNLDYISQKLSNISVKDTTLVNRLEQVFVKTNSETHKLKLHLDNYINNQTSSLNNLDKMLESLSYKNILKRGYVVIRDSNQKVITRASEVSDNDALEAEFQDGKVNLTSG